MFAVQAKIWERSDGPYSGGGGYLEMSVCVEVLWPSQPNGVMSSAVSFPNHTLLGRLSPLSG